MFGYWNIVGAGSVHKTGLMTDLDIWNCAHHHYRLQHQRGSQLLVRSQKQMCTMSPSGPHAPDAPLPSAQHMKSGKGLTCSPRTFVFIAPCIAPGVGTLRHLDRAAAQSKGRDPKTTSAAGAACLNRRVCKVPWFYMHAAHDMCEPSLPMVTVEYDEPVDEEIHGLRGSAFVSL